MKLPQDVIDELMNASMRMAKAGQSPAQMMQSFHAGLDNEVAKIAYAKGAEHAATYAALLEDPRVQAAIQKAEMAIFEAHRQALARGGDGR